MVAVLACSQTRGGRLAAATASPTRRVVTTRDCMICWRLLGLYLQLTLHPARLMTAPAPSNSALQAPCVTASHRMERQGVCTAPRLIATNPLPGTMKRARQNGPQLPASAQDDHLHTFFPRVIRDFGVPCRPSSTESRQAAGGSSSRGRRERLQKRPGASGRSLRPRASCLF